MVKLELLVNSKDASNLVGEGLAIRYILEGGIPAKDIDFKNNRGDILVSNMPFSKKKEVFTRLLELDKPFIMICPSSTINTQYIRKLFSKSKNKLQIIIPRKRIHFIKKVNGVIPENWKNSCNFDCFYYCYKMGLERDITWLDQK